MSNASRDRIHTTWYQVTPGLLVESEAP